MKFYELMPDITGEEMVFVQTLTNDYSDEKLRMFATIYRARRRDPQMILLVTLLGFLGFAGVQRFLLNQIGMGILYFFTAGFCLIGTIVDLINYQQLSFAYNRQMALEASSMLGKMA
ncbi:MAG: TM2 domain-containing protein [Bacteroidales bacterium]|jgi:TM2 domain-containing membrane protein YozV